MNVVSKEKAQEKMLDDKLSLLQCELTAAKHIFDKDIKSKWATNKKYAAGDQYDALSGHEYQYVTNYVYRNNESIVGELRVNEIDIEIVPQRIQFHENRKLVKGAISYAWEDEELGVKKAINRALDDLVEIAEGITKVTYLFEKEDREFVEEVEVEEDRPIIKQGKKVINKIKGKKEKPTRKKKRKIKEEFTIEDRILVESINPFDFLVDADCDGRAGLEGANLIFQRRKWTYNQMIEMIGEKASSDLSGYKMLANGDDKSSKGNKIEGRRYEGWEIWERDKSKENGWCFYFVDNEFKHIFRQQESKFLYGQPFCVARSKVLGERFYPFGRTFFYKDNQDEYNHSTSTIADFSKKVVPKYVYDPKKIEDADVERIANGEEMSFIQAKSLEGEKINNVVTLLAQPQLPKEHFDNKNTARNNIDEISGVTNTFSGGGADKQEKATLGVLQDRGASRRITREQSEIEGLVIGTLKRVFILMQTFLDKPIMIKIDGREKAKYEEITKKDLDGDYTMRIRLKKKNTLEELMGIFGIAQKLPQATQPDPQTGERVNLLKFLKIIIEEADTKRGLETVIEVMGDPVDENRRMLLGENIKPRKGENHEYHIAVHKKEIERAKKDKVDEQIIELFKHHLEETFKVTETEQFEQATQLSGGGKPFTQEKTAEGQKVTGDVNVDIQSQQQPVMASPVQATKDAVQAPQQL